ncbi:MAG: hypothetical protein ABII76_21810 [Pseudomonadota bacterium]
MTNLLQFPSRAHLLIDVGEVLDAERAQYQIGSLRYFLFHVDEDGTMSCLWDGTTHAEALETARGWGDGEPIIDHTRMNSRLPALHNDQDVGAEKRWSWRSWWPWVAAWLLIIGMIAIPTPRDSTDGSDGRSGMRPHIDAATGCEYLSVAGGGITPRLAPGGMQMGCRP